MNPLIQYASQNDTGLILASFFPPRFILIERNTFERSTIVSKELQFDFRLNQDEGYRI